MNTAEEIFKDQPESITPSIQMDEPNAPILIYEGDFELKKGSDIIKLQGKIKYVWFPSKGAIFQGTVISFSGANYREIINGSEHLDLCFNGSDIGKCFITGYTLSDADRLNGVMVRSAVTGQKTVPVSTVKFVIPNFISFIGTPIKTRSAKSFHSSNGRITLRNEIYEIIIDKAVDYKERQKLLDSKGGYLNLYYGQITKLNGTIIHEELDDVLSCFSYYLSFLNGAKCSPFFLSGMTGDKVTWRDFSNRSIAPYKQKITWPYTNTTKGLNELWNKMYALWQDKSAKDFLSKAIDWYVETNSGASFVEGHIVMAQTDLELIYNWLLVETNELLIGKDASNIAASNKIRLLLA
ncbi:MAG: hypothetical protein ACXVNM_01130, partial [Bacteroidia bacterium]